MWFKSKPEIRSDDYVSSIDQLVDKRARGIAKEFGLEVDAIYPLCTQANQELSEHYRHLQRDVEESEKQQVLAQYKLLWAAAAVVSYELSSRPSITFPKPTSDQAKKVPKEIRKFLKSYSWKAGRLGPPEKYAIMGRIFEENLRNLDTSIADGKLELDVDATYERL